MTPQQRPPHVQTAMARAELKALQGQQAIAEYGVELLSNVAAELDGVNKGDNPMSTTQILQVVLSALVALVSIRLAELQTAATANDERIAQLEGFLTKADSRIAIPNLQV